MGLSLWPYLPSQQRHSYNKSSSSFPSTNSASAFTDSSSSSTKLSLLSLFLFSGLPSHIGSFQRREYRLSTAFACEQIDNSETIPSALGL